MKYTIIFLLLLLVIGCRKSPESVITSDEKYTSVQIINLEMGQQKIIYINDVGMDFIKSVELFQKSNPDIKIISVWADGTGTYGNDKGHYLLIEKIK